MNFQFPHHNIPVKLSDHILGSKGNFAEMVMINGKNYRITKNKREFIIAYRINNPVDIFFLVLLQLTCVTISLEASLSQEHTCEIQLKEGFRVSWIVSIVLCLLVSVFILFFELMMGVIFLLGFILIVFIQYKLFEVAIKYISFHIEKDIYSIVNYFEKKAIFNDC